MSYEQRTMNVLFVSAILPYPLRSGGQVRLYNLLKLLSKDHDITLYTYIRSEKEREYVKHLSFLKNVHLYYRGSAWQAKYIFRSIFSMLPFLVASYENSEMRADIESDIQQQSFDLIHCEPFYVYPILPPRLPCPLVVGEHNVEHEVYASYVQQFPVFMLRPFMNIDVHKMEKREKEVWQKAKHVITVSAHDQTVVEHVVGKSAVTLIPNGVDTNYFSFTQKSVTKKGLKMLFVGNFLWMPNVKAVERLLGDIWPSILKNFPLATLTIVGTHLSEHLQKQARAQHVLYQEHVEDIREAYKHADILMAPMTISGGTKFKILEAMASGCLVITTKAGMEGIQAEKDTHYLQAETAEHFISAIRSISEHAHSFQTITKMARALIVSSYDWKEIARAQSIMWKNLI